MDLRELYEEVILDHNRNPRNYPKIPVDTNCTAHGYNPLCGDEVQIHIRLADGTIEDIGFEGQGCAIATASASLLTEGLKGKTEEEALDLFNALHDLLIGESDDETSLGKLAVLAGVKDYPMRVKCATLAWHTLQAALRAFRDDSVENKVVL